MLGRVTIGAELLEKCPEMVLATVCCSVINSDYSEGLWSEIGIASKQIVSTFTTATVKQQPVIYATRQLYKRTGKDPNRYRPSAEALLRRLVRGIELYQINTLVDLINLLSLTSGYSIGGFDADYVSGAIRAGIGAADESFEGIGRGILNVEGLPILRDEKGPIGTPTSDEMRTRIRPETKRIYLNINGYLGESAVLPAVEEAIRLLKTYAAATDVEWEIVSRTS